MDVDCIIPTEVSQRNTTIIRSHSYVESKKAELKDTESRLVVARCYGQEKWGETFSFKMNKFWGSNVQHDEHY